MTTAELSELGRAALAYAARGLAVFPVWGRAREGGCACGHADCSNPAKHPLGTLAPAGLNDATTDAAKIRRWWRRYPNANIGIRTGADSHVALVDVDPKSGGDESLRDLERQHGALPDTWRVLTGGGGLHVYAQHPGREVKNSTSAIAPGIDIRGDGGYAIAPPSVHITGRRYEWEAGYEPGDVDLAPLPAWVPAGTRAKAETNGHARLDVGAILNGVAEGARNDQIFRLAAKLRGADIPYEVAARLVEDAAAQCDPPLDHDEAIKALNSAYSRYQPNPQTAEVVLENVDPETGEITSADQEKEWTVIPGQELRAMALPPIEWLLEGMIPMGRYVVLSGESGLGKSWWALALALCAGMGLEFLGRETRPLRALYIDEENGIQEAQRRLRALADGLDIDPDADIPVDFLIDEEVKPGNPRHFDQLVKVIQERGIGLVITDSMIRFFDGDENSSKEAKAFHKLLDRIRRRTGVTWIMLQHLNKAPREAGKVTPGDRLRGTGEFKAHSDVHIQLRGADSTGTVVVHMEKLRGGRKRPDFVYRLDGDTENDEPITLTLLGGTAAALGAVRGAVMEACEVLDMAGTLTTSELIEAMVKLGIPKRTAERGISEGRKSGAIVVDRKEGKFTFLRVGEAEE